MELIKEQLDIADKQRKVIRSKMYEIWQDNDAPQGEYASSSSPIVFKKGRKDVSLVHLS